MSNAFGRTEKISGWAGWEAIIPRAAALPAQSTSSPLFGLQIKHVPIWPLLRRLIRLLIQFPLRVGEPLGCFGHTSHNANLDLWILIECLIETRDTKLRGFLHDDCGFYHS